jgi:hypothetical protein
LPPPSTSQLLAVFVFDAPRPLNSDVMRETGKKLPSR